MHFCVCLCLLLFHRQLRVSVDNRQMCKCWSVSQVDCSELRWWFLLCSSMVKWNMLSMMMNYIYTATRANKLTRHILASGVQCVVARYHTNRWKTTSNCRRSETLDPSTKHYVNQKVVNSIGNGRSLMQYRKTRSALGFWKDTDEALLLISARRYMCVNRDGSGYINTLWM